VVAHPHPTNAYESMMQRRQRSLFELGRLRLAGVRVDEAEEVRSPTRAHTAWSELIEVLGTAAFDRRSTASG
jgi:hypothetical protein